MTCSTLIDNQTETLIQGAEDLIQDFLEQLGFETDTEVSVVFCGDEMMRDLNLKYRNLDQTTDVLSFPQELDYFLGDIVISVPKAQAQAEQSLVHELETLLAHGLLHLLGYDHEQGEAEYEAMMALQNQLIKNKKRGLTVA